MKRGNNGVFYDIEDANKEEKDRRRGKEKKKIKLKERIKKPYLTK